MKELGSKDRVLHFLSTVQEPWYSIIVKIVNISRLIRTPERKKCYGEKNPDKIFYVIRNLPGGGWAGQYDSVLGFLDRAYKKGYTPVIDFNIEQPDNLHDDEREEKNSWDYYFLQPMAEDGQRYSLEDVYQSKNVIISTPQSTIYTRLNEKEIFKRYNLGKKIPFKQNVQEYFDKVKHEMLCEDTIGAYYRGTDYKTTDTWTPAGHPRVPEVEAWADELDKKISLWGTSKLYIVTEEQEALEYLIKRYPSAKYVKKARFSNFKYGVSISKQNIEGVSRYTNNLLYLLDIYILSQCTYLVGTWNGGIRTAINWNGNQYRDICIMDLGTN